MPEAPVGPVGTVGTVARTVGTLGLLLLALPANLVVTGACLVASRLSPPPAPTPSGERRTVLLNGGKMTKSLQLARSFHRAGHRVVMVEQAKYRFTGHRFSRAVDAFHVVPREDAPGYAEALRDVAVAEGVDVFVPVCSPVASLHDARAKDVLPASVEVVHPDADVVAMLDDKFAFSQTAASFGLDVPRCHRITDAQQVLDLDLHAQDATFILKSIPYDPVRRLDLTRLPCPTPEETARFVRSLPISEQQPWILQEFVEGQEYCSQTTVRDGRAQLHVACRSSASLLNYAPVDHPGIQAWVETFVDGLRVTGQLSFDFIESADGRLRAIECNPRTHSAITLFHDHPGVADAYLGDGRPLITPRPGARPTYWAYHEAWQALRHPAGLAERVRTVRRGKDAVLERDDPLPFLLLHHLQLPWLLLRNLARLAPWVKIDFNIGKLVEPAGD